MFKIINAAVIQDINSMRGKYLASLPYAQEHFIEDKIKKCLYYLILNDSNIIGYCCVNSEKVLFEFYLDKTALVCAQEVFKLFIDNKYFLAAECKTFDHLLMSLCLDFHKKSSCTAYLFRDYIRADYSLIGYDNLSFEVLKHEDINSVLEISGNFFKDPDELEKYIAEKEVHVLYSNNIILGVGLCTRIISHQVYHDVGMVVSKEHRNKGIGTYIIGNLIEFCCNLNLIPVCGCWYYNYASKRVLEKSGFTALHRMVRFDF
ncbi:MAG TPA: GNAT family N-acetyltransferase [Clostridiaceae bacterium]